MLVLLLFRVIRKILFYSESFNLWISSITNTNTLEKKRPKNNFFFQNLSVEINYSHICLYYLQESKKISLNFDEPQQQQQQPIALMRNWNVSETSVLQCIRYNLIYFFVSGNNYIPMYLLYIHKILNQNEFKINKSYSSCYK